MTLTNPRQRCYLAVAVIAATIAGCGDTNERLSLSGSVNQAGTPVGTGQISFVPAPGAQAPMAGTTIKAGQYGFDSETGPLPGRYTVRITAGAPPKKFDKRPATPSTVHEFAREVDGSSSDFPFELP